MLDHLLHSTFHHGAWRGYKRIVHLISDDGAGGGPATVQRHIKYYFKTFDIVLLHGGKGNIVEYCQKENVRTVRLPIDRIWKCLFGWIPLYYQLRKLKPDLFMVHGQWAAPLGALIGKLSGVKKIMYIAQWPAFYTDWDLYRVIRNHIVESIPVHLCDKVVCISPGNLYQYQIRFPDHLEKLIHISNPFDLSNPPTQEHGLELRREYGWRDDQVHVVSVGRIATQKHFEWLLASWVVVQREIPEARLWIVGSGEEDEKIHELSESLGITSTCTFLGSKKHGLPYINASDLVAMTTLYEGHANIPMEAHFCSKPIVANAVDGVRMSINDGEDGFLVPAGDIQFFADRLIALCRSRELREKMGEAGRKNVEKFSMEKVMLQYSEVIEELIGK